MSFYASPIWNVLEYLALFLIVLIHEFGHQLACRQVGGSTHDIVLFPFGGVAYVMPPQRPGAQLWSIAAGPLVNVVLVPILTITLFLLGGHPSLYSVEPNVFTAFINDVWFINLGLLIFNMMPIYPLDGGQILRSLLWFVLGRAKSLLVASIIGFIGVAGLFLLAGLAFLFSQDKVQPLWLAAISLLILLNCWGGLMQARALLRVSNAPRRAGFVCPNCKIEPPQGAFWMCGKCRKPFDTFATLGLCPHCGVQYTATSCPECGTLRPFNEWMAFGSVPPQL
ncbi:MAG TPA: M50 family metallopeptidase [Candidatus Saccharimonadales bacterium]|nr:M50 family metallopeptidase [Candidatus Saccharimonadales bacterium]